MGEANAASGLYSLGPDGWTHCGWPNVRASGFALDRAAEGLLFLASGNGVLRSRDGGASWRVTTDWRICEVMGVRLDPFAPERVYAATGHGLWRSPDGGETWEPIPAPEPRPDASFVPVAVLDRAQHECVVIATEAGMYATDDDARTWQPLGPRVAVRTLAQSAADPSVWLAGTDGHGVLVSTDGASTWTRGAPGAVVYAVALHPTDAGVMAAVGYGTDLLLSRDRGATWAARPMDLDVSALHALAFDPSVPGRLWLGTAGDGVHVTDDDGVTCVRAGLPETTLYALAFG